MHGSAQPTSTDDSWQPELLDCGNPDHRSRVEQLLSSGAIAFVHDTIWHQLGELVASRTPQRKLRGKERDALIELHLQRRVPADYGVWVHYPWSRRLVHVLPRDEFREVRTSRNRNKITLEEQALLASLCIGIVGLSVGRATAVTLALEGVGGEFRLADFDSLDLSNLNRLRAPLHDLGVNKAVSTAREIFEIDPFVEVSIHPNGVRHEDIDAFLVEPRKLSVLVEECDDLEMKVRLRERARSHRIPVLMETSDRGMIDVERFDREPERPIFHGLVAGLDAERLRGLDNYAKVPIVLQIIGAETMSRRLAASLVDVETTLETWPQLASAVALGGALNTDTLRRLALGQFHDSGRYWVDFEGLVRWPATPTTTSSAAPEVGVGGELPALRPLDVGTSWAEIAAALVSRAVMAPSGGNVQPWRFVATPDTLRCHVDVTRSTTLLDYRGRASQLACGAAAANVELGATAMGLALTFELVPDPRDETLSWRAKVNGRGESVEHELVPWIAQRVTNRRVASRVPLADEDASAIRAEAEAAGARLTLLTDSGDLSRAGVLLGECERFRMTNERLHREMLSEVRWTPEQVATTRDGLDLATLELDPTQRAGLAVTRQWSVMRTLRELDRGQGLGRPTRKAIEAASAVGLLSWPRREPAAYVAGGRALQFVWLRAAARGLAFQPMSSLVYLLARLEDGGSGFDEGEIIRLRELSREYASLFGPPEARTDLLLFRLAHADPPTARSLRRPVAAVLRLDGLETS